MGCRVVRSGTPQCDAFGAGILVCASGGHLGFIQSNLWLHSLHGTPQITGFTVMGYPPLLLSDKHQLITPFVSSWALDTSVERLSSFVFRLAFDKSSKAIDYRPQLLLTTGAMCVFLQGSYTDCMNCPLHTTVFLSSVYKVPTAGAGCRLLREFKVYRTTKSVHPNSASSQVTDDNAMKELPQ